MPTRNRPCLRLSLAAMIALSLAAPGRADLYAPNRSLLEIRTERFAIAFPPELEPTARRLASFADAVWEEVAAKLDPEGTGAVPRDRPRIPVMLTPDSGVLNAYRAGSPYGRIVLFAAPTALDSTLGSFADDLRSAFLHELTHELSLSIRSPFWRAMARAFGDTWAPAALWTASPPMIEGVTVAFESEDSDGGAGIEGRANDPLSMATVRQDLAEGVRRDWSQVSGSGDRYPWGNIYYHYGGAFSRWLRERRDPEAYAALWRELGSGRLLSGDASGAFSEGVFERTYGEDLDELWSAFLDDLTPRYPLLVPRFLDPGERGGKAPTILAPALASAPGTLFVADTSKAAVFAVPASGDPAERLFAIDGYLSRLDASADGKRLLVSYARTGSGQARSEVRVWDIEAGRWSGEAIGGMADAAFSRDGSIVGLEPGAFEADLVELARDGTRRVLLAGGPGRTYGPPVPLSDGSMAFAADLADAPDGARSWTIFRLLPDGELLELAPGGTSEGERVSGAPAASAFPAGGELGWPRFLSRGPDDSLLFSVAREGGLYRLARLEGGTLRVMGAEISGGVLRPVAGTGVYGTPTIAYIGAFSDGERLCVLDPAAPELATREYAAAWRPVPIREEDRAGASGEAEFAPEGDRAVVTTQIRAWNPWPWILRPLRWPVLDLTIEDDAFHARGLGAGAMFADPSERWVLTAETSWDFIAGAADLYAELAVSDGPFTLALAAGDEFSGTADGVPYRLSGGTAAVTATLPSVPFWRVFTGQLALGASRLSSAPVGDPYGGAPADSRLTLDASAAYSSLHRETRRGIFGEERVRAGFRAAVRLTLETTMEAAADPAPALEGALELSEPASGLSLAAWTAWAPSGAVAFGSDGRLRVAGGTASPSALVPWYPLAGELAGAGSPSAFYAQADLRMALATIELQGSVPLLSIHLNRATVSAGARAAAGSAYFQPSSYGRLELAGAPLVPGLQRLRAAAAVELGYAFGLSGTPGSWGWTLGLEIGY